MRIPQVFTLIRDLHPLANTHAEHTKKKRIHPLDISALESLLSDSNQRPRDYKSRALAN